VNARTRALLAPHSSGPPLGRGVDELLAIARSRLHRVTARDAYDAYRQGALLIDIRPEVDRSAEGRIPGALVIDRNVLEWRLDPTSGARLDVASYDRRIVLFCNEGYASSFAAAGLHDLGLWRATDMIGGYRAWRRAGLPVVAGVGKPPVGKPPSSSAVDSRRQS
jgi:rhodanese-related sulfurtransferase